MRRIGHVAVALALVTATGGPALAAGICQTQKFTCATTMPLGGYCECTARGQTEDGTVVDRAPRRGGRTNARAAGCGIHPNDPGCR